MSEVRSPRELFTHELQDVYYAEKTLAKTLPQLAREASDKELTGAFERHLEETRDQIANLELVFEQLGEPAEGQPCPGIDGIRNEHDEFVRGNGASGLVLDVFLTGAGAWAEHYEIAAYTGLVTQAQALGERDSARLLRKNLRQEKDALKTLEAISKRLLGSPTKERRRGTTTRGRARTGGQRRTTTKS